VKERAKVDVITDLPFLFVQLKYSSSLRPR
jgi:hypothetical protein